VTDHAAPATPVNSFDLNAYLARIGLDGAPAPSVAALELLHAAHLAHIPFENLDVRLGRPIRLDIESLQRKLVHSRRGGYCFEQNSLFARVLRELGFTVDAMEARVRPPEATETLPRTHMVLRVEADGRPWLADVGFGGDGPLKPVPLEIETVDECGAENRVVTESEDLHVLQVRVPGGWRDLYAFSLEPALAVDLEVANHFTSTHPRSVFVRTLTAQLSKADVRHILRGRQYTLKHRDGRETQREMRAEALPGLLQQTFGLDVPAADVLDAARTDD
jgi:N-hydroxyarylamine O-acetyltransferase